MHFEASQTVNAPREKAYAAFTDFEAMPRWSKQVATVRIVRREADAVYLEGTPEGKAETTLRKMRLFPPERVESEGRTRFTVTKRTITFEEVPAGTKMTAALDVQVRGFWAMIMTTGEREVAESSTAEELAAFARYVEGLP